MPRAAAHIKAIGMLGHGGVAVALDDVHGLADGGQFLGVHVAARAGAEEDDVPDVLAVAHRRGRHLAVVIEHEVVAAEQGGEFFGGDVGAFLDIDGGVVGAHHAPEHIRQIIHRVHEDAAHPFPRFRSGHSAQAGAA